MSSKQAKSMVNNSKVEELGQLPVMLTQLHSIQPQMSREKVTNIFSRNSSSGKQSTFKEDIQRRWLEKPQPRRPTCELAGAIVSSQCNVLLHEPIIETPPLGASKRKLTKYSLQNVTHGFYSPSSIARVLWLRLLWPRLMPNPLSLC